MQSVDRTQTVEALNGCSYFLVDVIANILCYLKEQLLCMIHDFGLESYESTDFDWVVTVPAIWKAKGKRMMREAGYEVIKDTNYTVKDIVKRDAQAS